MGLYAFLLTSAVVCIGGCLHRRLFASAVVCIVSCAGLVAAGIKNKHEAGAMPQGMGWQHKNGLGFTLFFSYIIVVSNMPEKLTE